MKTYSSKSCRYNVTLFAERKVILSLDCIWSIQIKSIDVKELIYSCYFLVFLTSLRSWHYLCTCHSEVVIGCCLLYLFFVDCFVIIQAIWFFARQQLFVFAMRVPSFWLDPLEIWKYPLVKTLKRWNISVFEEGEVALL